ncbi:BspA family leucine-rich repeat surface protein, partial [Gardnerella vaginalis]
MKKSNKHIRSVSNHSVRNRSVFVPLSAGFCATALAITGGVVANASAVSSVAGASSSVASSSSVVKSSATKVAKKANPVTGGGVQNSERSAVPTTKSTSLTRKEAINMAGCEAVIETIDGVKYLVIKPKGKATEGIISADIKGHDFGDIRDKIRSDEASGATLRFENNVKGYGSISQLFSSNNIESLGNIGDFDVSNVTDMKELFRYCSNLSDISGLSDWDTSNVTDMSNMFEACIDLKSLRGLEKWNTGKVSDMSWMFQNCISLEDLNGLESWNTSKVTNMSSMFFCCKNIDSLKGLEKWNTVSVTDMSGMFYGCEKLNNISALDKWNTGSVTDMSNMFETCTSLEDLSGLKDWNTVNVAKMSSMFTLCASLKDLDGLKDWNVGSVTDMSNMFYDCKNLTNISGIGNWSFKEGNKSFDMISNLFFGCEKLSNISSIAKWVDIFKTTGSSDAYMLGDRFLDSAPLTLTTDWFKDKSNFGIFSHYSSGAVFIFNEGNKIDDDIVEKFKTDKDIAELLKHNIIITNNDKLLKAAKDKKIEDFNHCVYIQYGNQGASGSIPSVLDSRVNGKVSTDIVEIVKHYIPTAVEDGVAKLRKNNTSLNIPTDYIAVASSELSSTSKLLDLFQTYEIKAAHTVTFKNGESKVATVKVEAGGKIADLKGKTIVTSDAVLTGVTMPAAPAKEGFTFKEWNTKADVTGTKFTDQIAVKADTTVYAIYTKNTTPTPPDPNPTPTPQPPTPEPEPEP